MACALQEGFEERGHEVVFFDAIPSFFIPAYSIVSRHLLTIWGFLFWTSNQKRAAEVLSKLSNKITEKKITQQILSITPDFIISDHPLITKMPEEIFLKNGHTPLGVVVVDPVTVHKIWFKGNPDVLFIPTEQMKNQAIKAGVPMEKIVFSGYPIRKEFFQEMDITAVRESLGLRTDIFTVMIGGSSEGIGDIEELCLYLSKFPKKILFQAIVICGRNKSLFKKLANKFYFDERFKILGFEKRISNYLNASDVVVSKAGPTNLFETVACGKPFIAFSCMPGQEEGNLDLIKKEKIGIVEKDVWKVSRLIKKLSGNPRLLEEYKSGILTLRKKQKSATTRIVDYVENYFK